MARSDVIEYFLQQQQVMLDTIKTSEEFDRMYKLGKITPEQREEALKELGIVKANYDRIAYIVFLLNQPKRKEGKARDAKQNSRWYDYLEGSSKEALLDESKDALSDFKEIVRNAKR